MEKIIELQKCRQVVRLGESEEAPAFEFDLSTTAACEKAAWLANVYGSIDIERESDIGKLVAVYRDTVEVMLGEGSWDKVKVWVSGCDDASDEDVALAVIPLILYLVGQVREMAVENRVAAFEKYLSGVV